MGLATDATVIPPTPITALTHHLQHAMSCPTTLATSQQLASQMLVRERADHNRKTTHMALAPPHHSTNLGNLGTRTRQVDPEGITGT
jgi:hypothetical protein